MRRWPRTGRPPGRRADASPASSCACSRRWNLDRAIRELEEDNRKNLPEWQRAPLLKGELVLLLNPSLEADLAGAHLRYDREEGLVYQRGGDE